MKYLNKKYSASDVLLGEGVMFLGDFNEASLGSVGTIQEVGEGFVTVEMSPKTAYEQEQKSLRTIVTVPEASLKMLAFEEEVISMEATNGTSNDSEEVVVDETADIAKEEEVVDEEDAETEMSEEVVETQMSEDDESSDEEDAEVTETKEEEVSDILNK